MPSPALSTGWPTAANRSTPRCPGDHWSRGCSNRRRTAGPRGQRPGEGTARRDPGEGCRSRIGVGACGRADVRRAGLDRLNRADQCRADPCRLGACSWDCRGGGQGHSTDEGGRRRGNQKPHEPKVAVQTAGGTAGEAQLWTTGRSGIPLWTAPVQRAASAARRATASCSTSSRLQKAKRTRVRAASSSSQKTDTGTPTTPHSAGICRQKSSASLTPRGAASAITK